MNSCEQVFPIRGYDLAGTLTSGQAFRWQAHGEAWVGVIDRHWVRLQSANNSLRAETIGRVKDWRWLTNYLQMDLDLSAVLASFPDDQPMRTAVSACQGLRLLRQNPWECLASFILSSTKQIVQIEQIIKLLCERYGDPLPVLADHAPAHAFPTPTRLASLSDTELRNCKMGFRAPYLLATARLIAEGGLDLTHLHAVPVEEARAKLIGLPGVGPKIADCVLLFAYGFPSAFPVDVWIMKALRQLYFPGREPSRLELERFTRTYFGINAGYAQQYLFHYMRKRRPDQSLSSHACGKIA